MQQFVTHAMQFRYAGQVADQQGYDRLVLLLMGVISV